MKPYFILFVFATWAFVNVGCGSSVAAIGGEEVASASADDGATEERLSTVSATSSAGGGGGSGEPTNAKPCSVASDCPRWECNVTVCENGACAYARRPRGTPAPTQIAGDCRLLVCLDALAERVDDSDRDDGDDCTVDTCDRGTATHDPAPSGTPCTMGEGCLLGACR